MDLKEFILVGATLKPHGLQGEINIKFRFPLKKETVGLKTLFLGAPPHTIPYFIEKLKAGSADKFLVKFEDVNSRNQALSLCNSKVYYYQAGFDDFFDSPVKNFNYENLIGFMLYDEDNFPLGKIDDILELPQQKLAQVIHKKKEILIPLHEEIIIRLDEKEKLIQVRIPDGLLDLYTD